MGCAARFSIPPCRVTSPEEQTPHGSAARMVYRASPVLWSVRLFHLRPRGGSHEANHSCPAERRSFHNCMVLARLPQDAPSCTVRKDGVELLVLGSSLRGFRSGVCCRALSVRVIVRSTAFLAKCHSRKKRSGVTSVPVIVRARKPAHGSFVDPPSQKGHKATCLPFAFWRGHGSASYPSALRASTGGTISSRRVPRAFVTPIAGI
jgi:hypothetical protein